MYKLNITLALSFVFSLNLLAAPKSGGELLYKWGKSEVKICWLNSDRIPFQLFNSFQQKKVAPFDNQLITPSDEIKNFLKNIITTEYTKERTGIHFTGWENCNGGKDYDVMFMVAKSKDIDSNLPAGRASIGMGESAQNYSKPKVNSMSFVFIDLLFDQTLKVVSFEDYIKSVILHEFGHLSGLRHEHIRPEAKHDPSCAGRDLFETPYSKTSFFSTYDPSSIMNYCFNSLVEDKTGLSFDSLLLDPLQIAQYSDPTIFSSHTGNNIPRGNFRIGLSKKDVHALKCMYQYTKSEFNSKCHESYEP